MQGVRGVRGVHGCVGWQGQGQKLSLCRDTVFNLAEGTIEGKVLSMYSWVPSAPPARRRTELGSSSLPHPSPPWARNVLGEAVLSEGANGRQERSRRERRTGLLLKPRTRGT